MAAGTLSVTNNSKAVVGVGTTFTAFKAGDFLTLVVGQVPYTVAIASIESATALTLVLPFDGPTATGLAWDGVKRDTMSLATMGVTVQAQKALRLMIADENNWRAIFGDAEEITVTLPNGQVMQGMSWGYLSQLMKQIDPVEMRNLQQQAAASEAAAQGFRNEAEGFKTETAGIRDATNQIKADTQAIHDATNTIKTQTDQIKTDTQAIKDQTDQIKTDTGVIRDEANAAKAEAQAASTAAQGFRDQTEELVQSVNPDNLLTKSGNLAGLTDKTRAWLNVRPDGATPLAGDPVGDYDATTKRWVQNLINYGTIGPTMNGVMNYGVGDFHLRDSRAYIQPYEVVSDGQLLNRADWPELWAYAQMLSPIEDADWLADPANRGKYSLGDGTTTFRVPDRNGVQSGSIAGLYGRGDGVGDGTANSSINGEVFDSGAPNITGDIGAVLSYGASGAFAYTIQKADVSGAPVDTGLGTQLVALDAAKSSEVYGRYDNEIMGRNFVGVWVIRASGGFVAANTSWSVINGDATRPIDGTRVESGKVSVEYKIGTAIEAQGKVYTAATMGGQYSTQLSVKNATTGKEKDISVTEDGDLRSDRFKGRFGTRMDWSQAGWVYGTFSQANQYIGDDYSFYSILSGSQNSSTGYKTHTHIGQIHNDNVSFADSCWHVAGDDNNAYGVRLKIQPNTSEIYFYHWSPYTSGTYTIAKNAISDANLKHDIAPVSVDKSWANLQGLEFVTFVYNNDEQNRVRRGVIAQQAETVEPLYVKTREFYDNDHVKQSQKELDTHPMLLDTMHVVQTLMQKIEAMEAEIAALKK